MTSPTTPRDAIGLSERLREDFLRGEITVWNILPEAATQLDALSAAYLQSQTDLQNALGDRDEAIKQQVWAEDRATRAEQERDEAYEERDALVREYQRVNAQLAVEIAKQNGVEAHPRVKAIRRLASGPDKEK